ncbi:MAG: PIN domain-containing protein [Lentisphaeraceae bacterium]|nr:PIN domain-containing protein [Lentisphaeraceae bacterium]
MVLVDTGVWIDFFNNRESHHVELLIKAVTHRDDIAICGVILAEVLQGVKSDKEYKLIKDNFTNLSFIEMPRDTYLFSSEIYRKLRKKGLTVRKPIDCMIASVAIKNNIPLLHNDRDFDPIEEHCDLRIYH